MKIEAKKRKELEKEEAKLKELESIKAQARAEANIKAKVAEMEGRLLCTGCQSEMFPNAQGVYEFEGFRPGQAPPQSAKKPGPAAPEEAPEDDPDDGVLDLMDMVIPEDQEEQIRKTLEEKTKYKEVAPTWELNMESYGYGKRKRAYDPDYEHVETARFKEYERLEGQGLPEELKDPDHDKLRNINAPGLGSTDPETGKRRKCAEEKRAAYTTSDYVVPPKVPQLLLGSGVVPRNPRGFREDAPGSDHGQAALPIFELPPEVSNPQKSPCVNVPEWFVKEGGELCLSDTANGMSRIRYWPKFLSDKGNHLMFNRMRKYVKWHQKQMKVGGEWKYETRLVAWYGPCDYNYSGLNLDRNPNWCPELLDLLHRFVNRGGNVLEDT